MRFRPAFRLFPHFCAVLLPQRFQLLREKFRKERQIAEHGFRGKGENDHKQNTDSGHGGHGKQLMQENAAEEQPCDIDGKDCPFKAVERL